MLTIANVPLADFEINFFLSFSIILTRTFKLVDEVSIAQSDK